ncbi:HmuY family protein [Kordia zhangzhouensis]|uniref:HmuY family protein n=1 Tax=Kordia zhangzhouensis TaxID=1620405 RepID=UPI0006298220|nr:HmuY family protein [Kordia zhangzhouensis]
MKTIKFLAIALLFVGFISCNNDDDATPELLPVNSETISNLHAPQNGGQGQPVSGAFAKFNFATGETTTSDTEWDIAFRGTSIIVNGGTSLGTTDEPERTGNAAVYIANGSMSSITEVATEHLMQDSATSYAIATGSGNGWYTYAGPPSHVINPTPGKILVIRTHDGKYAKVEILSYYKDAPANPDAFVDESRYFTFNFVYQPNDNVTNF